MKTKPTNILLFILTIGMVLMIASCSAESPTRPEPNPLVGKWTGSFVSPFGGVSSTNSLTIHVLAGSKCVGSAFFIYEEADQQVREFLFLELEISPEGDISGIGTWLFGLQTAGYYLSEGEVSGKLNVDDLTGQGTLVIIEDEGSFQIDWNVIKAGNR